MIAEALKVPVVNSGVVPGGNMPLGGGAAVRAFVEGVRQGVFDSQAEEGEGGEQQEDVQME